MEPAVRDHGGDGPAVLLLHGAGRTLEDWAAAAPLLAAGHRVWAMDLRGHGRSGDGAVPWTFDVAVDDVTAVLAACGAPDAVVVGHSMGGMIAARCLERDGRVPAAVNLDGHGMGRPEQYRGLDTAYVRERLAEARRFADEAGGRRRADGRLRTGPGAGSGGPGAEQATGDRRRCGRDPRHAAGTAGGGRGAGVRVRARAASAAVRLSGGRAGRAWRGAPGSVRRRCAASAR
ncbi:alpha/beta fold hydrolase [Streptomyces sp. NPDC001219]